MSAAAPVLSTRGLSVRFGAFVAVRDVDLRLEPGARQALIGPNGAGKTTLINLLTGALRPTSGSIMLGDRDISTLRMDRRARLGITRTFQVNALFPQLSPLQSVMLAIAEREGLGGVWWRPLRHYRRLRQEAEALLDDLKLGTDAHTRTGELAYGRQRLLEIALALAAKPRILLLDEPAAGVPEDESHDVFAAIAALPAHISVLFIEHDMRLVFRFAQRISVLAGGAILAEGTPAQIADDEQVRAVYLGHRHG